MSSIKRRHFLQFAGSTLAAIGLSQFDVMGQGDRYGRVLAQSTPRKLALLVGINAYPVPNLLQGCLTDIELQQELLVHRFGFNPSDILTVTDAQATRQGILTAFQEHLIGQAKPGDVVVFHFSGHGGRVSDAPDCDDVVSRVSNECLNSTIVPVDYGATHQAGVVQDITGHTLFLLMKSVQTDRMTVVLDSCHSGGGKRGELTIRSRQTAQTSLQISPNEQEFQQQLLSNLRLSPQDFIAQRRAGVAQGVVIAAARRDQFAADAPFSGFHAGAFSYLMTKYLWQQTGSESVGSTIANVSRSTTRLAARQIPELEPLNAPQPTYFQTAGTPPAEAIVTQVSGQQVQFWLGGVDADSLAAFEHATFEAIDAAGHVVGTVQQTSRNGLRGTGTFTSAAGGRAREGLFLQEQIREIPNNFSLKIGLDASLGSDQTQAALLLAAIDRITPVPQGGDFLLGRVTAQDLATLTPPSANPPAVGSISLFSPDKVPVPGSYSAPGESMTDAISRLRPKLRSLLAAQLLRLVENTDSSRLNVAVTMNPMGRGALLAGTATSRGGRNRRSAAGTRSPIVPTQVTSAVPQLPDGTQVQFHLQNNERDSLYIGLLSINAEGKITPLFPIGGWSAPDDAALVAAGGQVLAPDPNRDADVQFKVSAPFGFEEVLTIASAKPIRRVLEGISRIANPDQTSQQRGSLSLDASTDGGFGAAIGDVLGDVDGTRGSRDLTAQTSASRGIAAGQLAVMSIAYQTVPAP